MCSLIGADPECQPSSFAIGNEEAGAMLLVLSAGFAFRKAVGSPGTAGQGPLDRRPTAARSVYLSAYDQFEELVLTGDFRSCRREVRVGA